MEWEKIDTLKYGSKPVLTTSQLSEVFESEKKTINRNFQRNKSYFKEGKHYILLTGDLLKNYKETFDQKEIFKFFSVLYLWTKEGAFLLSKSCCTMSSWEECDSILNEIYKDE